MDMFQNILIGLVGWTILALVGGLCIGNALRVCGQFDGATAPVRSNHNLKKTA
jgi:hypothetical protein